MMAKGKVLTSDLDEGTEALADSFMACIEGGDAAGIGGLCTSDVTVWHNDDGLEFPLSAVVPKLIWLHRRVAELRYDDIRRRVLAGGYLQQHVLRGLAPGGKLALAACLVVTVTGGRISRIEEYLDTGSLGVLRR
jgi:ketosteroid isomerase-like protein